MQCKACVERFVKIFWVKLREMFLTSFTCTKESFLFESSDWKFEGKSWQPVRFPRSKGRPWKPWIFTFMYFLSFRRHILPPVRLHRLFWSRFADPAIKGEIPRHHEHDFQQSFAARARGDHFSGQWRRQALLSCFRRSFFFWCCCNISISLYASVEDTKLARKANNEGKHKNGLSSGGDCYRLIYSRVSRALRHRDKLSHLTLRNFPFPEKKSEKKLQKFFNSIRSLRCQ